MMKKQYVPSKKQYIDWYKSMLLMRKFEEKLSQLYVQRKFGGFLHLYIGQEAIAAGSISAIKKEDNIITAYRCHAHPLGRGTEPKRIMAELFGKTTGLSKGKGGSMHIFDIEKRIFGGHGIVGGQIPLGAGLAFAEKFKNTKAITLCYMGDGAVRQGSLHETFNLAMIWKLPVVFIIENNHYAMGTSVERTTNVKDLSKIGLSYEMPSASLNGMDVVNVHKHVEKAAAHARSGKGPYLLNIETYRYKGHSMSDPRKYRTKKEEEDYQQKDPIDQVLEHITKNKFATKKEIEAIGENIKIKIKEAIEFAETSDLPVKEDMYNEIYSEPNYPFIKD